MREIYDIRIANPKVLRLIPSDLGIDLNAKFKQLPTGEPSILYHEVRKIVISSEDAFFPKLAKLCKKYRISSVQVSREYSEDEIAGAEAFQMIITKGIETDGEECGTEYVRSNICPYCGVGIKQVLNLKIKHNKLPKKEYWVRTYKDEFLVSRGIADTVRKPGYSGIDFMPVENCGGEIIADWFQPIFKSRVRIDIEKTEFGLSSFYIGKPKERICPLGHTLGTNLLSELHLKHQERLDDFSITNECKGSGPMIVISPRVRELFEKNKVNGVTFEIAHIPDK